MKSPAKGYVPAAGHDLFLPLYDPLLRLLGMERARRRFLAAAALRPGERVLEIGCGTGTLAVRVKQQQPQVRVTGLDPDSKALARARAKAQRAGVEVAFDEGRADALPYADASFDRVLSSLMLHHLSQAEKLAALREAARVLAPGGMIHVVDFGPPSGRLERALTHFFDHGGRMADNLAGRLPELMAQSGLAGAREVEALRTAFGRLAIYEARVRSSA
jgi:ubiquinone/menaquinone biosynthesis C-methylase UbiE